MEVILTRDELSLLIQTAIIQGYNHEKTDDIGRDSWNESLALVSNFLSKKEKRPHPVKKLLDFYEMKK